MQITLNNSDCHLEIIIEQCSEHLLTVLKYLMTVRYSYDLPTVITVTNLMLQFNGRYLLNFMCSLEIQIQLSAVEASFLPRKHFTLVSNELEETDLFTDEKLPSFAGQTTLSVPLDLTFAVEAHRSI
jgi:hypothetical protein